MQILSSDKIRSDFLKVTKLTVSQYNHDYIIENAKRYVEKRIVPETLNEFEIASCEYAACAHAVYDYTLQSQLAEKIIITQLGKTLTDYRHESVIQSALAFRKCVFDSMRDLIRDDDFVFQTMEG